MRHVSSMYLLETSNSNKRRLSTRLDSERDNICLVSFHRLAITPNRYHCLHFVF